MTLEAERSEELEGSFGKSCLRSYGSSLVELERATFVEGTSLVETKNVGAGGSSEKVQRWLEKHQKMRHRRTAMSKEALESESPLEAQRTATSKEALEFESPLEAPEK